MEHNFRMGKISTMFIYFLEGFVALILAALKKQYRTDMVFLALGVWLVGFFILLLFKTDSAKLSKISIFFTVTQLLLTAVVSVGLALAFENAHILYLFFFLQWLSNQFFFHYYIANHLLLIHTGIMVVLTYIPKVFSTIELAVTIMVLICVWWMARNLNKNERRQQKQNADQQQSLDDMLELVEAKFEEAKEANSAKSSFLANMSHEIRTPINTVLGLDTMILRESKDAEIQKYAMNIQNAGQSLLALINDILDFSKIESGKMDIIPVEYNLADIVNDVAAMITDRIREKNLQLFVEVDEELPAKYWGDDVRIRQILINLLTNAVKYTHEGSITLGVKRVKELADHQAELQFCVKDTGIGIKPEDKEKLFQKFVRVEEQRNRNIEGTGLGINIVTQLLFLMGSELEVDSEYNVGSNFHFTLVQRIMDSSPIGKVMKERKKTLEYHYETPFEIPDVRLLVVDDNSMNRLVFTKLLKALKCSIDEADSGNKCLELVQKNKYDIIFMDHMMPEMDGIETLHHINEMENCPNENTPVIVLTANAIAGAKESYLQQGFEDYLSKPIDPAKLEKRIRKWIPEEKKVYESHALPEKKDEENQSNLPEVEGVDWDYALLKLKNMEIVKSVVKDFATLAQKTAVELEKLYNNLELFDAEQEETAMKNYRIKVHAMKTNAASIGAVQVSALARVLEKAAIDENKNTIERLHSIFIGEWLSLKERLDVSFGYEKSGREKNPTGKKINNELLTNYLNILEEAIKTLDTETADSIVDELKKFDYNEDKENILDNLEVAVQNLDIDATLELIGAWKNQ